MIEEEGRRETREEAAARAQVYDAHRALALRLNARKREVIVHKLLYLIHQLTEKKNRNLMLVEVVYLNLLQHLPPKWRPENGRPLEMSCLK